MKKVLKLVKGKKDEKKESEENRGVQSGEAYSRAQTPDDEKCPGVDNSNRYSVDICGKDKSVTKLHKAAWQGNLEKLKCALKKVDIDAVDKHNRSALHFAVSQGNPNIVWFLLGSNAKTAICDDDGRTPLMKAIECGHKECMCLLLEREVDINGADYTGNTGLHIAVKHGSLETVSILLSKGASTEIANNMGDYPLHIATKLENKELLCLLLNGGAAVDPLDRENRTPLMLAAKMGNLLLTNLFFDYGAQLTIVDSNGWTAEDYAMLAGYENVAASLKNHTVTEKKKKVNADSRQEKSSDSIMANPKKNYGSPNITESSIVDDEHLVSEELTKPSKKLSRIQLKPTERINEKKKIIPENPESPGIEAMPPFCQPPRSWDMIQAGMIDDNNAGTEPKRRSLTALGTLHSRRESFTECAGSTSPKCTLSLNRKREPKTDNSFAKQRFSFTEEKSLKYFLSQNPEKQEHLNDFQTKKLEDGVAAETSGEDSKISCSTSGNSSFDSSYTVKKNSIAKGKTLRERESLTAAAAASVHPQETKHPFEDQVTEDSASASFPPPPTALELGADMAKSLKYVKGVSQDDFATRAVDRSLWKKTYDRHSLDCLEEKSSVDTSNMKIVPGNHPDHKSTSPTKHKSQHIPICIEPKFRPVDMNKRINEQLECYDQALRELAESSSTKSDFEVAKYNSLPSCMMRSLNEGNERQAQEESSKCVARERVSVYHSTSDKLAGDMDQGQCATFKSCDSSKNFQNASTESGGVKPNTERKGKKHMLLAMREVKHAVDVVNAFKTSFDDQILSPLSKPEADFDTDNKGLNELSDDGSPSEETSFFALPRQKTVLERQELERKSSSSGTGNEPTLWLQNSERKRSEIGTHGSDEDVSEITEDGNHNCSSSFSPLGVIYREIQNESRSPNEPDRRFKLPTNHPLPGVGEDNSALYKPYDDGSEEAKSSGQDQSPDLSLSSGPIEPLGTEKDSGSDPESSHNDITPTHRYSLKSHQEWLKAHLKSTTLEKDKLEEIAAQLVEKAERLEYELADAREATKSRDEVIKLLREQLNRMENAYTKSLEESVQSRLQISSNEQEILHLKEICYKYEEDRARESTDAGDGSLGNLELKVSFLEGEKERLKDEIRRLEQEKTSLIKRLKEVTESDIIDQCQRWKERYDAIKEGSARESPRSTEKWSEREKNLVEKNSELEKKLSELMEKNAVLSLTVEKMKAEKADKVNDFSSMQTNGGEIGISPEGNKSVKKVKNKNNCTSRRKVQYLVKRLKRENKLLIKSYENKMKKQCCQAERCLGEKENLKEIIKRIQERMTSFRSNRSTAIHEGSIIDAEYIDAEPDGEVVDKSFSKKQEAGCIEEDNEKKINDITVNLSNEKYSDAVRDNGNLRNAIIDLRNEVTSLILMLRANKCQEQMTKNSSDAPKERFDEEVEEKKINERKSDCRICERNANLIRKMLSVEGEPLIGRILSGKWRREVGGTEGMSEQFDRNGRGSAESEKGLSYEKLELLKLRREIAHLHNKMSGEKAFRQVLENQIQEISADLKENQNLEHELHMLKKEISKKKDENVEPAELSEYKKAIEKKREKYFESLRENNKEVQTEYKMRCEILAKERQKSNEIKRNIRKQARCFGYRDKPDPFPASRLGARAWPSPEPLIFLPSSYGSSQSLTLDSEIKNRLEEKLDKSISKHKPVTSSPLTSLQIGILRKN